MGVVKIVERKIEPSVATFAWENRESPQDRFSLFTLHCGNWCVLKCAILQTTVNVSFLTSTGPHIHDFGKISNKSVDVPLPSLILWRHLEQMYSLWFGP